MLNQSGRSTSRAEIKRSIAGRFSLKATTVKYSDDKGMLSDLAGTAAIYHKDTELAWLIPAIKGEKLVSFAPPVLTTDKQVINLTSFNVERRNYHQKTQYRFEDGFTLNSGVETVFSNGDEYRWTGTFPKVVPVDSSINSTGGVESGKWEPIGNLFVLSKLASSIGASLIGINGGGNLQNVLSWVTPEQYGALGGGADDTVAVQKAIVAAETAGTGGLLLGDKVYKTGKLTISKSLTIKGQGKRSRTKLSPIAGLTGDFITIAAGNVGPTFDGVNIEGDWTNRGSLLNPIAPVTGPLTAISIEASPQYSVSIQLESSTIVGFSGKGIYSKNTRNMGMLNYSSVLSCAEQCLYIASAVDWMLLNSSFGRSLIDAMYLNCDSLRMVNSESYESQGKGIVLGPLAVTSKIIGCHINSNGKDGIHYDNRGGSEAHMLIGNVFFSNGNLSKTDEEVISNGYANVRLTSSARLFKPIANGHFNYADSNYKRVAYLYAAASTGTSNVFDASDDIMNPIATGLTSQSAAVAASNIMNRISYTDTGTNECIKNAVQTTIQKVSSSTQQILKLLLTSESFPRYALTAGGIWTGKGTAEPTKRIGWTDTTVSIDGLAAGRETYSKINTGHAFSLTSMPYKFICLASGGAAFTLPDASAAPSGTVLRLEKTVASGDFVITALAGQLIYGPAGANQSSVTLSAAREYKFTWDATSSYWMMS